MSEWVQVKPGEVNGEAEKTIRGVNVKVSASPYDVPLKVRGFKELGTNFFVIEFQYPVSGESTRVEHLSHDLPIILEVGEKSERIYKIKVDIVAAKADAVGLEIVPQFERDVVDAIKEFSLSRPNRLKGRYEVTEKVVESNKDRLFSTFAHQ
jgi:hypothetical protein